MIQEEPTGTSITNEDHQGLTGLNGPGKSQHFSGMDHSSFSLNDQKHLNNDNPLNHDPFPSPSTPLNPLNDESNLTASLIQKRRRLRRSAVTQLIDENDNPEFTILNSLNISNSGPSHAPISSEEKFGLLNKYLSNHPLFSSNNNYSNTLYRIYEQMNYQEFQKGALIQRKNSNHSFFYLIHCGKVLLNSDNNINTDNIDVSNNNNNEIISSGGTIGDLSLWHDSKSQYNYIALSNCFIFSIETSAFRYLINEQNKTRYNIISNLFNDHPLFKYLNNSSNSNYHLDKENFVENCELREFFNKKNIQEEWNLYFNANQKDKLFIVVNGQINHIALNNGSLINSFTSTNNIINNLDPCKCTECKVLVRLSLFVGGGSGGSVSGSGPGANSGSGPLGSFSWFGSISGSSPSPSPPLSASAFSFPGNSSNVEIDQFNSNTIPNANSNLFNNSNGNTFPCSSPLSPVRILTPSTSRNPTMRLEISHRRFVSRSNLNLHSQSPSPSTPSSAFTHSANVYNTAHGNNFSINVHRESRNSLSRSVPSSTRTLIGSQAVPSVNTFLNLSLYDRKKERGMKRRSSCVGDPLNLNLANNHNTITNSNNNNPNSDILSHSKDTVDQSKTKENNNEINNSNSSSSHTNLPNLINNNTLINPMPMPVGFDNMNINPAALRSSVNTTTNSSPYSTTNQLLNQSSSSLFNTSSSSNNLNYRVRLDSYDSHDSNLEDPLPFNSSSRLYNTNNSINSSNNQNNNNNSNNSGNNRMNKSGGNDSGDEDEFEVPGPLFSSFPHSNSQSPLTSYSQLSNLNSNNNSFNLTSCFKCHELSNPNEWIPSENCTIISYDLSSLDNSVLTYLKTFFALNQIN